MKTHAFTQVCQPHVAEEKNCELCICTLL